MPAAFQTPIAAERIRHRKVAEKLIATRPGKLPTARPTDSGVKLSNLLSNKCAGNRDSGQIQGHLADSANPVNIGQNMVATQAGPSSSNPGRLSAPGPTLGQFVRQLSVDFVLSLSLSLCHNGALQGRRHHTWPLRRSRARDRVHEARAPRVVGGPDVAVRREQRLQRRDGGAPASGGDQRRGAILRTVIGVAPAAYAPVGGE